MFRVTKLATGVALALGVSSAAHALPAAVADGMLHLTNFVIQYGDGLNNNPFTTAGSRNVGPFGAYAGGGKICSTDPTLPGNVCSPTLTLLGTENADATAGLYPDSFPATTVTSPNNAFGSTFSPTVAVGPDAGAFVAGTPITAPVAGTTNNYSASQSSSVGNSVFGAGAADVILHSQVSIGSSTPVGRDGSAFSNQNLSSSLFLTSTSAETYQLSFDAERFWRGALAQAGIEAKGSTEFYLEVIDLLNPDIDSNLIMSWKPGSNFGSSLDGSCVSDGSCTQFSNPFSLNGNADAPITGGNQQGSRLASNTVNRYFELELALDAGQYQFKITGKSAADAAVSAIPEPSSILLLGIGLLGLCSGLRRARKQV